MDTGRCFNPCDDITVPSPGQFGVSEKFFQGCISQEANMEYFRMRLKGWQHMRDLKYFLFPLVQESSILHGCTTWNGGLKNKLLHLDSLLPEGILWEVKGTESFPDSPVLQAASVSGRSILFALLLRASICNFTRRA